MICYNFCRAILASTWSQGYLFTLLNGRKMKNIKVKEDSNEKNEKSFSSSSLKS
jgi:hypothetical protein